MNHLPFKKLWLDTETTGVDPKIHGIIEIAAILTIEGKGEVSSFRTLVRPWDACQIAEGALQVSGITIDQMLAAPTEKEALGAFTGWLRRYIRAMDKKDKAVMAGFNIGFDDQFLRALAERVGEKYLGSFKYPTTSDVRSYVADYLGPEMSLLPDTQLGTVALRILGKEKVDQMTAEAGLHNALTDIRITKAVYDTIKPSWSRD